MEKSEDIKGYLVWELDKKGEGKKEEENSANTLGEKFRGKLLKEFGPIMLKQYEGQQVMEYDSFDQCVDEYFSQADRQRERQRFDTKEEEIMKKVSRIKDDQLKRI